MAPMCWSKQLDEGVLMECGIVKDVIGNKGVILCRDNEGWNVDSAQHILSCALGVIVFCIMVAPVGGGVYVVEFPHGLYILKMGEIPFPWIELSFSL